MVQWIFDSPRKTPLVVNWWWLPFSYLAKALYFRHLHPEGQAQVIWVKYRSQSENGHCKLIAQKHQKTLVPRRIALDEKICKKKSEKINQCSISSKVILASENCLLPFAVSSYFLCFISLFFYVVVLFRQRSNQPFEISCFFPLIFFVCLKVTKRAFFLLYVGGWLALSVLSKA